MWRSRSLVAIAAILWSTSGLFAKAPIFSAWPLDTRGALLAFYRTLFAGLCLLPFVRRPSWTWWLVPATLLFAVMSITYMYAITKTTAANAIWLQHTAPFWVFLIGATLFREPIQRADWLMLAAVLLGVGLIVFFEVRQQSSMSDSGLQGVMLGLVSGFFYAMVVLSVRALRDLDSAWLISLNLLVTAVVLLPYVLYLGVLPSFGQASWLVAFGAFQLGLPYVLFARGVRHMPSHQASFIVLLEPLLVPFWVWLAWRNDASYERPSWWTLVGGSMILVGLISRFGFDRSRSKSSS
ncbi:MAG: EamA family transporter [Planctomycetaceae bacterium]|nr:EamA family transporter [Planctomycetaceae bacterium]